MGGRLTTIAGLRRNGEEFPAEAAISKLQVGEKKLLTVALRDVTERLRIEEELKAANASLDAIIENIPLMLFIKESHSLRFVRFNRAGEDLLGWPKETFIGKSDYDLWPQDQAEFFIEKDREALRKRQGRRHTGRTDPNAPSRRSPPAYEESADPRQRGSPDLSTRDLGGHHRAKPD